VKQAVGFANINITVEVKDNTSQKQRGEDNDPDLNQHPQLQPRLNGIVEKPFALVTPLG
jgi:hypothetical protein